MSLPSPSAEQDRRVLFVTTQRPQLRELQDVRVLHPDGSDALAVLDHPLDQSLGFRPLASVTGEDDRNSLYLLDGLVRRLPDGVGLAEVEQVHRPAVLEALALPGRLGNARLGELPVDPGHPLARIHVERGVRGLERHRIGPDRLVAEAVGAYRSE